MRNQYRFSLLALLAMVFSFAQVKGVNLALNKTTYTSSNYNGSFAGNKAVDGTVSVASKWTSDGANAFSWIYVDLGSTQTISHAVVKHAGAAGEWTSYNTSDFGVYVWNGSVWVLKDNVTGNTQSTTTHYFSASARYVMLQVHDAGIDNHARIPEFEVHGGGSCISLNSGGTSSIGWTFANSQFTSKTCGTISAGCGTNGWNVTCSSGCGFHGGDDYYADDWIRYNAQDENISCGENVYAPFGGTVLYADRLGYSYGRTIIIQSSANNNFAFRVAHLQEIAPGVTQNGTVSGGQYIGKVGDDDGTNNGGSYSDFVCHPHFVLYKNINSATPLANLGGGHAPSGSVGSGPASTYAAPYYLDAACANKQGMDASEAELRAQIQNLFAKKAVLHSLEVFPHPIQGSATLRWEQSEAAAVSIKLVNTLGQTVREISTGSIFDAGVQSLEVSADQIQSGMYFLILQSEGGTLSKKVTLL